MGNKKMTNMILSTSAFTMTLDWPVKTKTIEWISKKEKKEEEEFNAVISITPLVHSAQEDLSSSTDLWSIFSKEGTSLKTKKRQKELHDFLDACGEKIRSEIQESCEKLHLENICDEVDHCYINLLDKSGDLAHSMRRSPDDLIDTMDEMLHHITHWEKPKKMPRLYIPPEEPKLPKPRRKEKLKGKEGEKQHIVKTAKH